MSKKKRIPPSSFATKQDLVLLKKFQTVLKKKSKKNKLSPLPPSMLFHSSSLSPIKHPPTTNAPSDAETLLRQDKIACFLVAGGQGTRLGFLGPKGCFPITPIKKKSLYQLFAEKINAIQKKYHCTIPLYIMTSEATHEHTKKYFEKYHYFGLTSVSFHQQDMWPTLSKEGKLLFTTNNTPLNHPNGHGGAFSIFKKILPELCKKNIEHLFYFQVDNVLANICDPYFLDMHIKNHAEMSTKAIEKTDPEEKVGILGMINRKPGVIEYSDLSQKEKYAKDQQGKLIYHTANTAIHLFSVNFIKRLKNVELPLHIAFKKQNISLKNINNKNDKEIDVIKMETFIFDLLPLAKKTTVQLVPRNEEFAPLKNKIGLDSPTTAVLSQNQLFASWCEAAGFIIPKKKNGTPDCVIEISPSFALTKEDFIKKAKLLFTSLNFKKEENTIFNTNK